MRLHHDEFVPLLVHTTMDPGASISMPEEIVGTLTKRGFPGCGLVDGTRFLGWQRAAEALCAMSSSAKGAFRLLLGCEVTLILEKTRLRAVLFARNELGWIFLRNLCTRPQEESGPLELELDALRDDGMDLMLLVRKENVFIQREALRACRDIVPETFLGLPRPDSTQEKEGLWVQVPSVAAPDIHCLQDAHSRFLSLWRKILGLPELDSQFTMTLHSINRVQDRFFGARHLVRQTRLLLEKLEPFDPRTNLGDETSPGQLARKARTAMTLKGTPPGLSNAYWARLESELSALERTGLSNAILEVLQMVQRAKAQQIPLAPGHGHLTCSLIAWALGMSRIDPIRFGLPFGPFLRCAPELVPTIRLTMGEQASAFRDDYLSAYPRTSCLAWRAIRFQLEDCARLVCDAIGLDREEASRVVTSAKDFASGNVNPTQSRHASPMTNAMVFAREAALRLWHLPRMLECHPTGFLFAPMGHGKMQHAVAPISWDGAGACGYLPIELRSDPSLDGFANKLAKLTVLERHTFEQEVASLTNKVALKHAMLQWKRAGTGRVPRELPWEVDSKSRPQTFEDLVILHGLGGPGEDAQRALKTYFTTSRSNKVLIKRLLNHLGILAETRGVVVFEEQLEHLMKRELRISPDDVERYLDPTINGSALLKLAKDRIIRHAHTPVQHSLKSTRTVHVERLDSHLRKKMYARNVKQWPPSMSWDRALGLHQMLEQGLKVRRSKTLALIAAFQAYEIGVIEAGLVECSSASPGVPNSCDRAREE